MKQQQKQKQEEEEEEEEDLRWYTVWEFVLSLLGKLITVWLSVSSSGPYIACGEDNTNIPW